MITRRLVRLYRAMRFRKTLGLAVVMGILLFAVLGNTLCFLIFEQSEDGVGFTDAIWYSVISITTIGYGDYSASSLGARLGTVFFIVFVGLGTFSVFVGMMIDWVTDYAIRGRRGMNNVVAEGHILIVNFPSRSRVEQLIREVKADAHYAEQEIVLVTDQIEEMPFTEQNVNFVRGPILEQETYQRANLNGAKMVMVLATSYSDPNSDAVVASAISVIESLNKDIYTVAECLNPKHKMLFESVNCNSIVYSMAISGNLMVQEAWDPGISRLVEVITSNVEGTTLYSTPVLSAKDAVSYHELAVRLLDDDINMLAVNRSGECLTGFMTLKSLPGDRIVYAGSQRLSWEEMLRG